MNYNTGLVFGALLIAIVGVVAFFIPFWLLWNWLMPLFGLPEITILQSIGLYLLLRLIFLQTTYTHTEK